MLPPQHASFASVLRINCSFGDTFVVATSVQERSKPIMEAAREKLAKEKGASALEPWNLSHALSGDVEKCVCHSSIGNLFLCFLLWSVG